MAFQEQNDEVMASINITPLTDVLLVLLIIFMITAAAIQKERLHLPATHYKNKAHETDLVISIQKNQALFVGAKEVSFSNLEAYLAKLSSELEDKVIIKADQDVPYGTVARAMDAARSAGLNNISLATKPLDEQTQAKEAK